MERIRREWEQHVKRMDPEGLVKISRDNIPAGRRSPGLPKRRWSDLIPELTGAFAYNKEEKKKVNISTWK